MKRSYLIILMTSVLLTATALSAQDASSGKVRSVLGEVTRQKQTQSAWLPLRVGAKVIESDLIRTLVESQTIISLPDGSSITIEENSVVVLEKLFYKKSAQETSLDVKRGMLHFDVQKQAGKSGSFKFKTGTATAAIRGTSGALGIGKKGLFASLGEGSLEVVDNQGNTVLLKKGQTLVQDTATGFIVVDNPLSGNPDFSKGLNDILNDTNSTGDFKPEDLDSLFLTLTTQISSLLKRAQCQFDSIADTLYTSTLQVKGKCNPGITLSIDGEQSTSNQDGSVSQGISWDEGVFGEKTFSIYCVDDNVRALCGQVHFAYADSTIPKAQIKNDSSDTLKVLKDLTPPKIQLLATDSLRCRATLKVVDSEKDEFLLYTYIDHELASESYYKGNQSRLLYSLKPGIHQYRFVAQDSAKNESEVTKTLGCFPKRRPQIQLSGPATEVLRVPPAPMGNSSVLYKELKFSIRNIPENDPRYIQRILIKKNGRIVMQLLHNQITDLHYSIPVEILRGSKDTYEIEVLLKSGNMSRAIKTYEVR